MLRVLIIKNWDWPDILRQTSGERGIWNGVKFLVDPVSECDYVIAVSTSARTIKVATFKENVWFLGQEPPNEFFRVIRGDKKVFYRVFTTESQPAIPWFVDKTYDFLKNCSFPRKLYDLSCITSFKSNFVGHRNRLNFLNKIKNQISFDLIATYDYYKKIYPQSNLKEIKDRLLSEGYIKVVKDKWAGLSPYKYSIIIENFNGPNYWSEKLADCFLSWTVPIYYGCTNIDDYFPKQSIVKIDINDPKAIEKIQSIVKSDIWMKRKKYIEQARNLVLDKYQFFPYITGFIKEWEKRWQGVKRTKQTIIIPNEETLFRHIKIGIAYRFEKIKTKFKNYLYDK